MRVAIVHDYLTQRGGAERVVLCMHRAFPDAPIFTSLYLPSETFPEFSEADVRPSSLNHFGLLRRHHRLALPLLAPTFSRMSIDSDVVLASSSGWAHGIRTSGTKIVYYYTPARWLYQPEEYLGKHSGVAGLALGLLRPALLRWDRRAATNITHALTLSRAVAERVRLEYGIDAELLPPPPGITQGGTQDEVEGIAPAFHLCVSRLLPYKHVGDVVRAFALLPNERLVVVGRGPERARLQAAASKNVLFLERVTDSELRWLYANSRDVLAASYEDFGLTPLEAASFGRPSVVLRWGGFLDTVIEGETGEFFDTPTPEAIADAIRRSLGRVWDTRRLLEHASRHSEARFIERLRFLVRFNWAGG